MNLFETFRQQYGLTGVCEVIAWQAAISFPVPFVENARYSDIQRHWEKFGIPHLNKTIDQIQLPFVIDTALASHLFRHYYLGVHQTVSNASSTAFGLFFALERDIEKELPNDLWDALIRHITTDEHTLTNAICYEAVDDNITDPGQRDYIAACIQGAADQSKAWYKELSAFQPGQCGESILSRKHSGYLVMSYGFDGVIPNAEQHAMVRRVEDMSNQLVNRESVPNNYVGANLTHDALQWAINHQGKTFTTGGLSFAVDLSGISRDTTEMQTLAETATAKPIPNNTVSTEDETASLPTYRLTALTPTELAAFRYLRERAQEGFLTLSGEMQQKVNAIFCADDVDDALLSSLYYEKDVPACPVEDVQASLSSVLDKGELTYVGFEEFTAGAPALSLDMVVNTVEAALYGENAIDWRHAEPLEVDLSAVAEWEFSPENERRIDCVMGILSQYNNHVAKTRTLLARQIDLARQCVALLPELASSMRPNL